MATKEEEKEDVDFSFPATTHPQPRFIGSPPLWQTTTNSPASYPGTPTRREDDRDIKQSYISSSSIGEDKPSSSRDTDKFCVSSSIYLHQRRSFSQIEDVKKLISDLENEDDDDVEEKMDMLWENFNEEFSSRKLKSRICDSPKGGGGGGMVNMGCVKLSKSRRNHNNNNNKPTLLVFMKVLKNLFLLQNSHRSIKKTTHWSR